MRFHYGIIILGIIGLVLSSALPLSAQADKHTTADTHRHQAGDQMKPAKPAAATAIDVGNKICPVMKAPIDEKTKVTYEYQGKIYNFCCPYCIGEFKKNPRKYIKIIEEESKKDARY